MKPRLPSVVAVVVVSAAVSMSVAATPDAPETPSAEGAAERVRAVRGADLDLLEAVRDVERRVLKLVGREGKARALAVRADASARDAAAEARRAIAADRLDARSRAWVDVGFHERGAPARLYEVLSRDLGSIAIDVDGGRMLVDPAVLPESDFVLENDEDSDTQVLLATGLRPDEPVVAHALTHVWQLARRGRDPIAETTDETLAACAAAEGEANLTALRMLFSTMGLADTVLDHDLDPAEVLEGRFVPDALRASGGSEGDSGGVPSRLLDFVYGDGFARAVAAFRAGGWPGVRAFAADVRTTRAVLHPGEAHRSPETLPFPEGVPVRRDGWVEVDRDRLGEFGVVALVSGATGKDDLGLVAGEGWLGDALLRWESPSDPSDAATFWVTRWESDEAAREFAYAYGRVLRARFGAEALVGVLGEAVRAADAGREWRVIPAGRDVVVAAAPVSRWVDPGS